jgi:hypothetical protein
VGAGQGEDYGDVRVEPTDARMTKLGVRSAGHYPSTASTVSLTRQEVTTLILMLVEILADNPPEGT